jgi:hypothetical protein
MRCVVLVMLKHMAEYRLVAFSTAEVMTAQTWHKVMSLKNLHVSHV